MDPEDAQEDPNVKPGVLDASKYNREYLKADRDLPTASTHSTRHPTFPKPSCLNCTVLEFITAGREGSNTCSKSQPFVNNWHARPLESLEELLAQLWRTVYLI